MSDRQGPSRSRARTRWASLAIALILVVIAAPSASASAAVPAKFWGVVPQNGLTLEQWQRLKRGGVDELRFPVDWSVIQSTQGGPDSWGSIDTIVTRASETGIEALPFLTGAPAWVMKSVLVNSQSEARAPLTLPVKSAAQRAAWEAFVRDAVGRYGPEGVFWKEHPGIPYRPIRTWQIWNEPNFKYFVARPNPVDYGKLISITYPAVKGVDPGAQLILGGLFAEPGEAVNKNLHPRPAYFATEFLRQMYRKTPGIKKKFSGIALHPYTGTYQHLAPEIEKVEKVLREVGDRNKGIWITELGWSAGPPSSNNSFAKGPQGQARQLKGAFSLLSRNWVKWHLRRVFWFSVDDAPGACNFCDGSGLFGPGFTPRPVWKAYVKFAGGTP